MSSANRLVLSILVIAAAAVAFYALAVSPKRDEAGKLTSEADEIRQSLAQSQLEAARALEAKQQFPGDYRQLVVLGEAVPGGDETSSLIVELNRIAAHSGVYFESIQLASGSGEGLPAATPTAPAQPTPGATEGTGSQLAAATIPPSEAAASLLPLGAQIGSAELAVTPYDLNFSGNFFEIAGFIHDLDALVGPESRSVSAHGRLLTINSFALTADDAAAAEDPTLDANFSVTSYLTPPGQGVTAGATPTAPAPSSAVPAGAETTPTESAPPEATTVSAPE